MVPGSGLALLTLLALVPGWVFLRLRQRHTVQASSSGLAQLLEVLAVGVATTGTAAAALALPPHRWLPFLADVDAWARQGSGYASHEPRRVLASVVLTLVLATALAVAGDRVSRTQRSEIRTGPGVWETSLRRRPDKTLPYAALTLQDGSLLEGLLYAFTLETSEVRDVALTAPVRVTQPVPPRRPGSTSTGSSSRSGRSATSPSGTSPRSRPQCPEPRRVRHADQTNGHALPA